MDIDLSKERVKLVVDKEDLMLVLNAFEHLEMTGQFPFVDSDKRLRLRQMCQCICREIAK